MPALSTLVLFDNNLTGALPAAQASKSLQELIVGSNSLSGTVSTLLLSSLSIMYAQPNSLSLSLFVSGPDD